MRHPNRHPRAALVALIVALLVGVGGALRIATLRAQPLFMVTPAIAQVSLDPGQALAFDFSLTNNSAVARTIAVTFGSTPAGLILLQQSTVSAPAAGSVTVPILIAASTALTPGSYVISASFQGTGADSTSLSTAAIITVSVRGSPPAPVPTAVPAPTAAPWPTGAPVPTAAPWPTEAPAATTAATARPAQAVRQYLPYSAQRALPTGMPTPTATRVIAMPTATATAAGTVEILDVVLRDPSFPDSSEEYVEIHNMGRSAVTIGGWRLSNASRAGTVPPYVFPSYTLGADMSIAVFSSVGDDDLVIGDFYWDRASDVWRVGDRAELRDALNNLISTLIVPSQ